MTHYPSKRIYCRTEITPLSPAQLRERELVLGESRPLSAAQVAFRAILILFAAAAWVALCISAA